MATICDQVSYKGLLVEVEDELKDKIVEDKGSGEAGEWSLAFHSAFDPQQATTTKQEKQRARANSRHGTYVVIKARIKYRGTPTDNFLHAKIFIPIDDSAPYILGQQFNKTETDRIEDF